VTDTAARNEATVSVRPGPLVAPVISRIVGMLAARAQAPIDRLDDALLVADAISAHGPSFVDGHLAVRVRAGDGELELLVGPLRANGARGLLESADLPGVGNVLERVADELVVDDDEAGAEQLLIRLAFRG
jgi:serine/threonine-protein kinase RsbW